MRMVWVIAVLATVSVGYSATVPEIRELLEKKEYQKAVREADALLIQQDPILDQQQIYDLIVLKAEALLRNGQRATAGDEFVAAARVAPDVPKMAWARASRIAIARSVNNAYVPQTGDKTPIDIIDPDSRQRAFQAIVRDNQTAAERAFRRALDARTLPEYEDAAQVIGDMWLLQLASTGKAVEYAEMLRQISGHARALITQDIAQLARRLAHMDRLAASYDVYGGRRGVSSRERTTLRELDGYLADVADRVALYRDVAIRIDGDPAEWDRLLGQVLTLRSELDLLLGARY